MRVAPGGTETGKITDGKRLSLPDRPIAPEMIAYSMRCARVASARRSNAAAVMVDRIAYALPRFKAARIERRSDHIGHYGECFFLRHRRAIGAIGRQRIED